MSSSPVLVLSSVDKSAISPWLPLPRIKIEERPRTLGIDVLTTQLF